MKIGDVIVINNPTNSWASPKIIERLHGEIGVVVEVDSFSCEVVHTWPSGFDLYPKRWFLSNRDMIKIGEL